VEYYAKRPQVQERMTKQIANHLQHSLGTEDVAVLLAAEHMCVSMRGVEHAGAVTVTSAYSGRFDQDSTRSEFLRLIGI
ncbi:MAG: cyclohydrolase FolE, partial [Bacteroidota bacterium]